MSRLTFPNIFLTAQNPNSVYSIYIHLKQRKAEDLQIR